MNAWPRLLSIRATSAVQFPEASRPQVIAGSLSGRGSPGTTGLSLSRMPAPMVTIPLSTTRLRTCAPARSDVSPSVLRLLRVTPAIGRFFVEGEDAAGAPPAVVLSDRLWRDRSAADPAASGAPSRSTASGGQSSRRAGPKSSQPGEDDCAVRLVCIGGMAAGIQNSTRGFGNARSGRPIPPERHLRPQPCAGWKVRLDAVGPVLTRERLSSTQCFVSQRQGVVTQSRTTSGTSRRAPTM
jgi:hypothetical protein